MSKANLLRSYHDRGTSKFWMVDHNEPRLQYYKTMHKFGGLVQAPRNRTTLGCLRASIAAH